MNYYLKELENILPNVLYNKKVDKLTVLRTTVQYIKELRGSLFYNLNTLERESSLMLEDEYLFFDKQNPEISDEIKLDRNLSFLIGNEFRQLLLEVYFDII